MRWKGERWDNEELGKHNSRIYTKGAKSKTYAAENWTSDVGKKLEKHS